MKVITETDKEDFVAAREAVLDRAEAMRDVAATLYLRGIRMHNAEGKERNPLTTVALVKAHQALQALPAQEAPVGLDYEDLDFIVEEVAKNPEVFLKRLPPPVAEEIRVILRKAEVPYVR